MHYQAKTKGGYLMMEVVSALQKDIRRGNEEQAMFWAHELIPSFEGYLWRRLIVIVNEDIGLANLPLLVLVPTLRQNFFEMRRERGGNGAAKLILANAILAMCRSPKSRLADEFHTVVEQDRRHGLKREMPDYALDKHTAAGRQMGRGSEHWLAEGTRVSPEGDVPNPYSERVRRYWGHDFVGGDEWGGRPPKGKKAEEQGNLFGEESDEE